MNDKKHELIKRLAAKTIPSYQSIFESFDLFAGDRKDDPSDFDLFAFEVLYLICSKYALPIDVMIQQAKKTS